MNVNFTTLKWSTVTCLILYVWFLTTKKKQKSFALSHKRQETRKTVLLNAIYKEIRLLEVSIEKYQRKPKIAFVYRRDEANIGDWMCTPLHYFSFFNRSARSAVLDLGWKGLEEHEIIKRDVGTFDTIIVGGGGLLGGYYVWQDSLEVISKHNSSVIWAAGLNREVKTNDTFYYPKYLENYSLVALRDYFQYHRTINYPYIGDVTCMSNHFDKYKGVPSKIAASKQITVAIFAHFAIPIEIDILCKAGRYSQSSCEQMGCKWRNEDKKCVFFTTHLKNSHMNFEDIIQLFYHSDVVLTSSYHGMWWATLLGRPVIAHPYLRNLSKPALLPYKPVFQTDDFYGDFLRSQVYPNALQRCRYENLKFYASVLKLILNSMKSRIYRLQ